MLVAVGAEFVIKVKPLISPEKDRSLPSNNNVAEALVVDVASKIKTSFLVTDNSLSPTSLLPSIAIRILPAFKVVPAITVVCSISSRP